MLYIVINVFIGGPLENQLVEGQPSLKELNIKYENMRYVINSHGDPFVINLCLTIDLFNCFTAYRMMPDDVHRHLYLRRGLL